MAKTDSIPTTTAACDTGRCSTCRGVVFSITSAHLTDCTHICHLPDAWAEQVAAYPPCDDDQELEQILDLEGDRLLENESIGRWS